MPRYLMYFSYIGTAYRGVQKQIHEHNPVDMTTVQGVLEAALRKLQPVQEPEMYVSSRTDSGVHALMNTAHVDLHHPTPTAMFPPQIIMKVVNGQLGCTEQEARVFHVQVVPESFHSRTCVKMRTYLFRLALYKPMTPEDNIQTEPLNHSVLPCVDANRCQVVRGPFDMDAVQRAAAMFVGVHDFSNFAGIAARRREGEEMVRGVESLTIEPSRGLLDSSRHPLYRHLQFYDITIRARSFLHRQIRRMVGALEAVGQGRSTVETIGNMLRNPSVYKWDDSINVAQPHALYLQHVEYDDNDLRLPEGYLQRYEIDEKQYVIQVRNKELVKFKILNKRS